MDDLDKILKMRRAVPLCEGLERRIIEITQPPILAFILLPRPVLMMIFLMVLGFGLGVLGSDFSDIDFDYWDVVLEEDEFGGVI